MGAPAAAPPPPPPTAGFESVDSSEGENLNEQTPATAAAPCQITPLQFQLWKRQKVCTCVSERECVVLSRKQASLSSFSEKHNRKIDTHSNWDGVPEHNGLGIFFYLIFRSHLQPAAIHWG